MEEARFEKMLSETKQGMYFVKFAHVGAILEHMNNKIKELENNVQAFKKEVGGST